MDSNKNTDTPLGHWLKHTFSQLFRTNRLEATAHPVKTTGGKTCFALAKDERWLRGQDNALALFDSQAAAERFLGTMKLEAFSPGEPAASAVAPGAARRCFQLRSEGLVSCRECDVGKAGNSPNTEDYPPWQEEDWSRWDDED